MVIQCDPVSEDASPVLAAESRRQPPVFTTLYWLTCPAINRHLGRYESEGWVRKVEEAAKRDVAMQETLHDLHGEYAWRRRRAVGGERLGRLKRARPKLAESLERTGIAGVSDPAHVKCLHAHAAFHLVQGGHPLFLSFPQLLKDVSDCRSCEQLEGAKKEAAHAV